MTQPTAQLLDASPFLKITSKLNQTNQYSLSEPRACDGQLPPRSVSTDILFIHIFNQVQDYLTPGNVVILTEVQKKLDFLAILMYSIYTSIFFYV